MITNKQNDVCMPLLKNLKYDEKQDKQGRVAFIRSNPTWPSHTGLQTKSPEGHQTYTWEGTIYAVYWFSVVAFCLSKWWKHSQNKPLKPFLAQRGLNMGFCDHNLSGVHCRLVRPSSEATGLKLDVIFLWLRNVGGSTQVPVRAWKNARKGTWGLHPPVKLERRQMTYTVSVWRKTKIKQKKKILWCS
jgi:hypothetical protein